MIKIVKSNNTHNEDDFLHFIIQSLVEWTMDDNDYNDELQYERSF